MARIHFGCGLLAARSCSALACAAMQVVPSLPRHCFEGGRREGGREGGGGGGGASHQVNQGGGGGWREGQDLALKLRSGLSLFYTFWKTPHTFYTFFILFRLTLNFGPKEFLEV